MHYFLFKKKTKQGVSIQVQISLTEIQWFPQQPANHVCLAGWLYKYWGEGRV